MMEGRQNASQPALEAPAKYETRQMVLVERPPEQHLELGVPHKSRPLFKEQAQCVEQLVEAQERSEVPKKWQKRPLAPELEAG